MIRFPYVAGMFYPEDPNLLRALINNLIEENKKPYVCEGIISPHAGYIYCGNAMGAVYSTLKQNDIVVILAPSHRYFLEWNVIYDSGAWITPLGRIEISDLAQELTDVCEINYKVFLEEHSIEVQLPFLQVVNPDCKIIPIHVGMNYEACEKLGKKLYELSKKYNFSIVSSSDFSHYLPIEIANKIDNEALSFIISLDPYGFFEYAKNTSICGFHAITAQLIYQKQKGNKPIVLHKSHSGEVEPMENVVTYIGVGFIS